MTRVLRKLALTSLLTGLTAPVWALDPLGLYVGAAAGQSDLGIGQTAAGDPVEHFDKHAFGWSLVAGVRPISFVGAEVEYFDLGRASGEAGSPYEELGALHFEERLHGVAAFAMGYLPLPLPWIDPFAKAGLARTRTNASDSNSGPAAQIICTGGNLSCGGGGYSVSETHVAWGAGVQVKLPATRLSLRAEYERFQANEDHQSLLSLGVSWTFF